MQIGIGGKGQNVAIAANIISKSNPSSFSPPELLQFVGKGFEGDQLIGLMQEKGIVDISHDSKLHIRRWVEMKCICYHFLVNS